MDTLKFDAQYACIGTRAHKESKPTRPEVRYSVRFPLALPLRFSSNDVEIAALTRNVSANGVLFEVESPLEAWGEIRFSLCMPGTVLGTPHDVLVHCAGRVVRCCINQTQYLAAATIDEYKFSNQ
jgi:hypothetical protein